MLRTRIQRINIIETLYPEGRQLTCLGALRLGWSPRPIPYHRLRVLAIDLLGHPRVQARR